MPFTTRQKTLLIVFGVLLAVALPVGIGIAEDLIANDYYNIQNTVHYNATDGPEVIVPGTRNIQSGNPFTDKSFNLSTETNGWVNISTTDADSSSLLIQVDQINGTWTNTSSINAPGGTITIDPNDKNESTVGDNIDTYKFRGDMEPDDNVLDFIYTGTGGTSNVTVRGNFTDGTQYGAVDADANEGLDVDIADSNGNLVFNELPESSTDVEVQELGTLFIRDEQEPHDLITDCTANVRFYEQVDDDPLIAERTTTSGQVDLTGLPVDDQFIATVKCQGWNNRTVIIEDLAEQETAFLINDSQTVWEVDFVVEDRTGLFADEAELSVQKGINRSLYGGDGFAWVNVEGDTIGASGTIQTTLRDEDRYRLVIKNQDGDSRVLGPYTPREDATETLVVGQVNWPALEGNTTQFTANISGTSSLGNTPPVIRIMYQDPQDETTDLEYKVFERGNRSNQIDSGTDSGPVGTFYAETDITEDQQNTPWIVELNYTYRGESVTEQRLVGLQELDIGIASEWINTFFLIGITFIGLLYGNRTVNVGIAMMFLVAGIGIVFGVFNVPVAWYIVAGVIVGGGLIRSELRGVS